ncbi:MAG TPA: LysM peptidoglycan-binding domain-containing protein [Verrucomicrobiales bacterium]|jgi:LysM repeat protein|nr:LysM peptidoglycan-binding domain-containing protein [Verrucomicrobiales bacterium]
MTPFLHRLTTGLLGLAACLTFNSCQSTGGSGSDSGVVDYTSPTSRMSRKEKENYAFDDSGRYRENWVAANSGAKVKEVTMSTDTPVSSPYVQDDAGTITEYNPGRASSPAYDSDPAPSVTRKSTASNSSSGARKSSSGSGSRKSTASNSSSRKRATASSKSKKPAAKPSLVTIRSGDTLSSLSRKSGVPVAKIKAYNGMKSDVLRDGKKIKIPPKSKPASKKKK